MSWRFPKHIVSTGQTVTPENLNEGIRPAAEELSGRLNEHNWVAAAMSNTLYLAHDVAFVWNSASTYKDDSLSAANLITIDNLATWIELSDPTITKTMKSCSLWIHVSLQFHVAPAIVPANLPHISLALKVDGQILQETIIGGGDLANDTDQLSDYRLPLATSIVLPVASGEHTVAVVARCTGGDTPIYIESRELIVLQMRK